jgi:hypothetical protein
MYGRQLLEIMERSLFGRGVRATPSEKWGLHYVGVEQLLTWNVEVFLLKAPSWDMQRITFLCEWKYKIKNFTTVKKSENINLFFS